MKDKRVKREKIAERALADMASWRDEHAASRGAAGRGRGVTDAGDATRVTDDVADYLDHLAKERDVSPNTRHAPTRATSTSSSTSSAATTAARRGRGRASIASRCADSSATSRKRGLGKRSIARTLSAVRSFYRYLHRNEIVDANPARAVGAPKLEKYLPGYLDRAQIDLLFQMAEAARVGGKFVDVRNLAILELFYSTGMRLSELQGMNRGDLDLVSQQVKVRGKGRKERIVPVGDHAHARAPQLRVEARRARCARSAPKADRTAFFLARTGKRIGVRAVQKAVTGFLDADRRGRRAERALAAPHVRDAPARRRRRPARRAGAARPRVDLDDADLHAHERRAAEAGLPEGAPAGVSARAIELRVLCISGSARACASRLIPTHRSACSLGLIGLGADLRRRGRRTRSSCKRERRRSGRAPSGAGAARALIGLGVLCMAAAFIGRDHVALLASSR